MPYAIKKQDSMFIVYNKETGKVKGHFKWGKGSKYKTKEQARDAAISQMRLLYGIENGMKVKQ